MMSFEIRNDDFNYQGFYLDPYSISDALPETIDIDKALQFYVFDLKMKDFWSPLHGEFQPLEGMPNRPIPDICTWIGSSLILSPKAREALHPHIDRFGELLPLNIGDETFYLFNCLTHGAHDELFSQPEKLNESGDVLQEQRIRFNSLDTKEKLLFKTRLNNCSVLYCNNWFKDMCMSNQLTGITFDELT